MVGVPDRIPPWDTVLPGRPQEPLPPEFPGSLDLSLSPDWAVAWPHCWSQVGLSQQYHVGSVGRKNKKKQTLQTVFTAEEKNTSGSLAF